MDKFVITGGRPLHGTMQPSGNKNAALPMMAACLLTEDPVILYNMPNIKDTQTMRQLLESLAWKLKSWKTHPPGVYRQRIFDVRS
jgi:UDP-N-acetylglucosamine 1-carboxyvinyltransferase